MREITSSPVTRLSGLLSVDVLVEDSIVIDARVKGDQFRGFEWMLVARDIRDAPYFTERICGICSFAHGVASNYLLDILFDHSVPQQTHILRDIMLALEFIQNHIRHFYAFCLPDYIVLPADLPYQGDVSDRRFSTSKNERLVEHYLMSFPIAAKAHEAQALFGGKAPHQHGMVAGGVAVPPTADKIAHAQALVGEISRFVTDCLVPDTYAISECYSDYHHIGQSSPRFITYGLFQSRQGLLIWPSGRLIDGEIHPCIDVDQIGEDISSSWYDGEPDKTIPPEALPDPAPNKDTGYTFVKSVHYEGLSYECGPLARRAIAGRFCGYPSTMARIVARSLEADAICQMAERWLRELDPEEPVLGSSEDPVLAKATSLTDAPRGALLHSAILNGEKIVRYGIVTPTAWNFSPKNRYGLHGPAEESLIGTAIRDLEQPVEIGRIVRAFDPCLSCATHLINMST